MNLLRAARSGILIAMGGLAVASFFGTGASLTGCGESASCTRLRDDTYAIKQKWDACNPDDPEPCIKVFGNPKDCTGVLTCDFAVNPHHRAEAERAALTIAQDSQGCFLCAVPNCVGGEAVFCEPVSRRCIVVTKLQDGGTSAVGQPTTPDAGVTPFPVGSDLDGSRGPAPDM